MSAWRALVRNLYEIGGGPAPRRAFDNLPTLSAARGGLNCARDFGLIKARLQTCDWVWTLTDLGRDWCEGRVAIVGVMNKPRGRPVLRPVATWLKALPRPGEIKL
jgi:hypothetical protein